MMATSDPGIFLLTFGVRAMMTTLRMPTMEHQRSAVEKTEVHVAGEAVSAQLECAALRAIRSLIESANDGEENRRTASPILVVSLPEILVFVCVLDALQFCSEV